jgi:PhnB protein
LGPAAPIAGFLDAPAPCWVVRPLQNQFYGERSGTVRDPFGHEWLLGGQIEVVTPEEMQRRYTALFEQ